MNLNNIVVTDTETSGPDPFTNQLLSVSFSPIDEAIDELEIYIRPDNIVWGRVAEQYFKKYEEKWNQAAITSDEAYFVINNYLNDNFKSKVLLLGHNIGFDLSFLKKLAYVTNNKFFPNLSYRSIDTHTLLFLYDIFNDEKTKDLTSALDHFDISMPTKDRHTSLGDSVATKKLFNKLLNVLK